MQRFYECKKELKALNSPCWSHWSMYILNKYCRIEFKTNICFVDLVLTLFSFSQSSLVFALNGNEGHKTYHHTRPITPIKNDGLHTITAEFVMLADLALLSVYQL